MSRLEPRSCKGRKRGCGWQGPWVGAGSADLPRRHSGPSRSRWLLTGPSVLVMGKAEAERGQWGWQRVQAWRRRRRKYWDSLGQRLGRTCGPSPAPLPHPFPLSFGSHVLNVCAYYVPGTEPDAGRPGARDTSVLSHQMSLKQTTPGNTAGAHQRLVVGHVRGLPECALKNR